MLDGHLDNFSVFLSVFRPRLAKVSHIFAEGIAFLQGSGWHPNLAAGTAVKTGSLLSAKHTHLCIFSLYTSLVLVQGLANLWYFLCQHPLGKFIIGYLKIGAYFGTHLAPDL